MISSIFLLLHLIGLLSASDAAILLIIMGLIFIIADLTLGLFFLVAFNGFVALILAAGMMTGGSNIFGLPIDWGLFFGLAVFEALLLIPFVILLKKIARQKETTGTEGMIGEKAEVVSWDGIQGKVRIQGEIWNAMARRTLDLEISDKVKVVEIDKLTLIISAQDA